MNKLNEVNQLRDWCAVQGLIYVQWYPYKHCSGYYIENPSEEALKKFYENIRVSDPVHESFVLILGQTETYGNLNMKTIDEYIKNIILPRLCGTLTDHNSMEVNNMTVRDIIQEEIENWNEEHQDNLIEIYKGDKKLCGAWVEDSEEELKEYMDMKCESVDYYSEATCVFIE